MKIAPTLSSRPTWKMAYQWCCPELLPPTTSAPGFRGIPERSSDVVSQVESPSTMVSGKKIIVEKPDLSEKSWSEFVSWDDDIPVIPFPTHGKYWKVIT